MNQYYLMAQLPSLDAVTESTPLPITEERFTELCNRFLGKRARAVLEAITLSPKRDGKRTGNALLDSWLANERLLRIALAKHRAEKMNKKFDTKNAEIPEEIEKLASVAVESTDPMEAEVLLNRFRLESLERLRPSDPFSEATVFYYGLKLKLISRIKQFDPVRGEAEYKNIYDSIMNGEKQETN